MENHVGRTLPLALMVCLPSLWLAVLGFGVDVPVAALNSNNDEEVGFAVRPGFPNLN